MNTKKELIEEKQRYEELLLTALEVYHRLPQKMKPLYDEMTAEYIKELKKLNQRISEMI